MSGGIREHKAWSYEDFVFLMENYPMNLSLREVASRITRSTGAVDVCFNTVKAWKKEGNDIARKGYSERIIRYCRKFFNNEDIDVTSKPQQLRYSSASKAVKSMSSMEPILSIEPKLKSIDEVIEVLKGRITEVIGEVLANSDVKQMALENKALKEENVSLKKQVDEYGKYKQAAKDSSVWGVLTKRFGKTQQ